MLTEPDSVEFLSPVEAAEQLKVGEIHLIDVRTADAHKQRRIPGSESICVYESAFAVKIEERFPDKAIRLVVAGEGDPFKADLAACEKLRQSKYTNFAILRGGLKQWEAAGLPLAGNLTPIMSPAGSYKLDRKRSGFRWTGRNLLNQHHGAIRPREGFLELDEDGIPVGGQVVLDMQKISCKDISDTAMNRMLIQHLESGDFFATTRYPEAAMSIRGAQRLEDVLPGKPNFRLDVTLAVRGKEIQLGLEAIVSPVEGGYVVKANFDFDRTLVGALYGSGRIFESLGMHLVADLVTVDATACFIPQK